jgi:hypothetical protein
MEVISSEVCRIHGVAPKRSCVIFEEFISTSTCNKQNPSSTTNYAAEILIGCSNSLQIIITFKERGERARV